MSSRDDSLNEQRPPCVAMRTNGQPCTLRAVRASDKCFAHAAEGHEAQVRGGKNRRTAIRAQKHLPPVLLALQETLVRMIAGVEAGTTEARPLEAVSAAAGRLIEIQKFALEYGEGKELNEKIETLREEIMDLLKAAV